jgi:hypothetical protein
MSAIATNGKLLAAPARALVAFNGCESTERGGGSVSGGVYYGAGFYDPWYYGGYDCDDPDTIVAPPGNRHEWGAHPEQPIARPGRTPTARPMPSIPSAPRGSGRR